MSLRGAYLALHRLADVDFTPYGITADQFPVLVVLRNGMVLTQADVCRRSHTDPNTMGSMLALMQTRGLVRRMRHPADGRVPTVVLTPKGKRVFTRAFNGTETAHGGRLSGLFRPEEVKALVGFLHRIFQEFPPPPRRRKKQPLATMMDA